MEEKTSDRYRATSSSHKHVSIPAYIADAVIIAAKSFDISFQDMAKLIFVSSGMIDVAIPAALALNLLRAEVRKHWDLVVESPTTDEARRDYEKIKKAIKQTPRPMFIKYLELLEGEVFTDASADDIERIKLQLFNCGSLIGSKKRMIQADVLVKMARFFYSDEFGAWEFDDSGKPTY